MFHAVPTLWRLHMMHHADMDFDLTTGTRFHPIEIIISMVIKISAITVPGAPAPAVIIFEVLLNGTAMFNHGDFRIALGVDRLLRLCDEVGNEEVELYESWGTGQEVRRGEKHY
jgi:sterol desaturase/sphingolipid hydroxylase (fatty acid hydroxylase superfamily)